METFIHPTAIVSTEAEIGPGVSIGPYTVIEGDVVIGDRTESARTCRLPKGRG